ncbi:DUF1236 domain-containing protein [Frigidibacter sp. MR17.24]|uniref:DUF1236 domain-containing protein n=1 Tax=Frigidibacter sp. MR17.24 TaxID=3127345 RepID=UPI003012E82B
MLNSKFIALTGAALIASTAAFAQSTTVTTTTDNSAKETGAAAGFVGGAATGAAVGGPVGAGIGAVVGAVGGSLATPSTEVTTYVQKNPVPPVMIDGGVRTGVVVPDTVTLTPVPEATQYSYIYVDGQPVLVDSSNRTVVRVVN